MTGRKKSISSLFEIKETIAWGFKSRDPAASELKLVFLSSGCVQAAVVPSP